MDYGLTDRVVIITGAGGGIGLESARAFVAEGARVVGGDLDPGALEELGDDAGVLPVTVDVTSPMGGQQLIEAALDHFGRVDVLFNNAGAARARTGFLDVSDDDWQSTLDLNFFGYVRTTRAILPHMLERGKGALIHTASEAGRMPNPRLPDYSVSKAAVLMLSKTLSLEFTPQGIRSNVVSPGFVRTAVYDRPGGFGDSLAAEYGVGREEAIARYIQEVKIPAGRLGRPEEVANAVLFLASDLADFVTGADVFVSGGVTPFV